MKSELDVAVGVDGMEPEVEVEELVIEEPGDDANHSGAVEVENGTGVTLPGSNLIL